MTEISPLRRHIEDMTIRNLSPRHNDSIFMRLRSSRGISGSRLTASGCGMCAPSRFIGVGRHFVVGAEADGLCCGYSRRHTWPWEIPERIAYALHTRHTAASSW
ncbi:hypothetical protein EV129_13021 [Rhizobium azibense]|uniref:Uncharacterized protein n=1 Tax=Rhizobium azibense TaxID=1136135 RepID=A0A4R3RAS2_9HYPH|nr:hypothetical protein EV129_13021 [Rhizobium azibense]